MMTQKEYEEFIAILNEECVGRTIVAIEPVGLGEEFFVFVIQDTEGNITRIRMGGNDCGCWFHKE